MLRDIWTFLFKHLFIWMRLQNNFKIKVLCIKYQRLCAQRFLQIFRICDIIDIQRTRKKVHIGCPWSSGPTGGSEIKTGVILSWKLLHGPRNTSRNHCEYSAFHKEETTCVHGPKTPQSFLGQSLFKMDWGKGENYSVVRQMEIFNSFWKTWTRHHPD